MIVKIQNRRGGYTDYDPSKLLPGEFAVVQVGDPNTPTGKGVYLAITAGDVVRLATTEEIEAYTQQFDDIYQSTIQDAGVILDEAKVLISNYTGNLIVVDSISDMTDTSSPYLYNGSGQYKNYVYVYDPSQSAFVPLVNYGMFADLSEQISQNASNIATNTSNIATNTTNIATNTARINMNTASINTNTTNIATNASNIAENAVNIAGLATGVTNKVVKTTLSTTQTYANATTDTYNYLSIPGISDYEIVMVRADCANLRQWLTFVNGDNTPLYLREYSGTNSIRGGYYVDWTNERIGVRYLGATGAYTSANVYFTNVVGFIKEGAIDGSGSSEFTPYQALYDAIIAYIDEHYASSSSNSVPYEVKRAIYTLLNKATYTETGLTDEIATVEAWTATTFNITNRLTNCTSSNSSTVVNNGTRYTATLTADSEYVLGTVTVTMGGSDITATVYSSGTITIPSVTGDIVITATAIPAATARTITNTLTNITTSNPASVVSDGSAYSATLTGATGYDYDAFFVTVTMGGNDITNTAYSDGEISIASVTGDVVITATTGSILAITQGTKSFTTGCKYTVSASGRLGQVTLSGNTGNNDAFTSYTNVSAMTTKSNDMANENNGGVSLMTLPANTTIRVECEFESVSVTDKTGNTSAINVHIWGNGTTAAALISQYAVGNISEIVIGQLYYKEFTLEAATDLHSIGLYLDTNYASAMDITYRMRMWVGGTRYI